MQAIKQLATVATVVACTLTAAATAGAQQATAATGAHAARAHAANAQSTADAKLRAEAKVTEDAARQTALKLVPGGKIESGEIEREKGKLIYSFDIKVAGKSGIEEVNVDAMTGAVVAHEHESPKAEKKEAAQEAKDKTSVKKP